MKIKTEQEFHACQKEMEEITAKGTSLGDMELLSQEDKERYIILSQCISEWEAAYHPLPGRVSTLIIDAIRNKMETENLKQKETAKRLGISESRVSDILSGRRSLNLNIVKRLRDNLGISADFILDNI
ncbi:helix-turn-helix domain-containing protein [uncultured Bacteroides sp.]|uniref:helix-turn-helix domain-containing protein n=1 Tax=uncultured Bacteroides sp. TaxID=162156 RepID=UPI0025CE0828|nr:helix-turn-helix domain-containing protein [uncultured Bacteroides sp.]